MDRLLKGKKGCDHCFCLLEFDGSTCCKCGERELLEEENKPIKFAEVVKQKGKTIYRDGLRYKQKFDNRLLSEEELYKEFCPIYEKHGIIRCDHCTVAANVSCGGIYDAKKVMKAQDLKTAAAVNAEWVEWLYGKCTDHPNPKTQWDETPDSFQTYPQRYMCWKCMAERKRSVGL